MTRCFADFSMKSFTFGNQQSKLHTAGIPAVFTCIPVAFRGMPAKIGENRMMTTNLSSQAYRHLHQQLTDGKLVAGAVLSETKLATELGISRTPVGDAVRQLAAEGLVEQIPRYGTVVKEITAEDIAEIYELRELIEPYAARKAASIISATQLKQLAVLCRVIDQLAEQLDASDAECLTGEMLRQFLAADIAFHVLIVQAADNSRILKVVEGSRAVSQVFRIRRPRHDSAIVHGACDHHGKILAALSASDGETAAEWMLTHVRQSREETLAFIAQEQDQRPQAETDFTLALSDDIRAELKRLEGSDRLG